MNYLLSLVLLLLVGVAVRWRCCLVHCSAWLSATNELSDTSDKDDASDELLSDEQTDEWSWCCGS